MNLMVVSEKHGLLIVAVGSKLYVYKLNCLTGKIDNLKDVKIISLENEDVKHI
jgi:hypothetical protein